MRTFKTPKKDRSNYNYYTVTGEKIEITPEAVGDAWVARLHAEDDAGIDAARRGNYHVPGHYDAIIDEEGDDFNSEKQGFLVDTMPGPLEQFLQAEQWAELAAAVRELPTQQIALLHTCVLIPRELASSAPKQPSKARHFYSVGRGRETLPQGVYGAAGGRYEALLHTDGRVLSLGTFGTPDEARSAYLSAKADALEAHAARIDADMSDEGREAVARCCARLRAEAAVPSGEARAGPGGRPCGT